MHSDVHHLLHTYRAAELQREAAELHPARLALRHRMGWTLVGLGLRLAQAGPPPVRTARAV